MVALLELKAGNDVLFAFFYKFRYPKILHDSASYREQKRKTASQITGKLPNYSNFAERWSGEVKGAKTENN